MNMIFLRGSIPPSHEHPEKLLYEGIDDCEDMWTQLFYWLVKKTSATGELVYQGGQMEKRLGLDFCERWVLSIPNYVPEFKPDVIICRGGFAYYDPFLRRFPKAFKVYYGAGERFFPQTNFRDYHLFLVDSRKQLEEVRKRTKERVELFVKPAALLFKPKVLEKKWDVCFMANAAQGDVKGHEWFLSELSESKVSVLNIGNTSPKYIDLARKLKVDVTWAGWHLRRDIPELISQCRVGVACSVDKDSCPRIIPEYLACDLPVVVTDDIHFWHNKYVTDETGVLTSRTNFMESLCKVLSGLHGFKPREYYDRELCLSVAVSKLVEVMGDTHV